MADQGNTAAPLPRKAHLLVVSTAHAPGELADRLGMTPDAAVARGPADPGRHGGNTWELHEEGGSDADISELLDSLLERALPLSGPLRELRDEGCAVILRLSLRFSAADRGGAGFAVSRKLIEWLDATGTDFIDVDQRVVPSLAG